MPTPVKLGTATAGTIANGSSTSFALPAGNPTLLLIQATVASYFRIGTGAQTATTSDTLILPGTPLLVSVQGAHTHLGIYGIGAAGIYSATAVALDEP